MVHDTVGGGEHDVTKLAGREQIGDPLLNLVDADVEPRGDDTALVETADEVDDDLARAVIINDLELTDVPVALHDLQELDDDLRRWAQQDLALSALLRVGQGLQGIAQY